MADQITGAIRFAAVYVVGWLVGMVLTWTGVDLTQWGTELERLIELAIGLVYYVLIRSLSSRLPWLEFLLVIPKAPVYVPPSQLAVAKRNTKNLK